MGKVIYKRWWELVGFHNSSISQGEKRAYIRAVAIWQYYLREHRTLQDLSQQELAEKSKVDQGTISDIETNPTRRRHGRVIRSLEDALDIPRGHLKVKPGSVKT